MSQVGCPLFSADQPEGMPQVKRNPYRVALTVDEVVILLTASAEKHQAGGCIFPDCEACNGFRACWWDIYNALTRMDKRQVAIAVMAHGAELPEGPWEEEA